MYKLKILRIAATAVLLITLCACSQPAVIPSVAETLGHTEAAASAQAEPFTGVDLESLLSYIAESGKPLEVFPALITGADTSKDGGVLHIDRLEYNPEFEIGGYGDEAFLINEYEKTEYIEVAEIFYAVYIGGISYDIDPGLLDYISGREDAQFNVFMSGDKVLFISEITVP
jgi:hypothetical protein